MIKLVINLRLTGMKYLTKRGLPPQLPAARMARIPARQPAASPIWSVYRGYGRAATQLPEERVAGW